MSEVAVHIFGENVLDVETKLDEARLWGASLTPDYFVIPIHTALRAIDENGIGYCGCIDTEDLRISDLNSTGARIPVDDKYDINGSFPPLSSDEANEWMQENAVENFVDLPVLTKSGGGGAHNCSIGIQVFLNDILESCGQIRLPTGDNGRDVRLHVLYGSPLIKDSLPSNLVYCPIHDELESGIGTNVNIALNWGKKLTFRSKPKLLQGDVEDQKVQFDIGQNDIVIIDSLKDPGLLQTIVGQVNDSSGIKLYLGPTDSMIKALGRDKVFELALRADLAICNEHEFRLLMDKTYKDLDSDSSDARQFPSSQEFISVLKELQNRQEETSGKRALIMVTNGDRGAVGIEPTGRVFYQPVAVRPRTDPYQKPPESVVNTSGCGDAFFALSVVGELLGLPPHKILDYANAAGHLCAFEQEASGLWMATEQKIKQFRDRFGSPPVYYWNNNANEFQP